MEARRAYACKQILGLCQEYDKNKMTKPVYGRLGKLGLKDEIHFFAKLFIFYQQLHSFSTTDKILKNLTTHSLSRYH